MTTHNQTVQSLQSLINGIEKNLPNGSFLLGGTTFTTPEVVDFLQSLIDALGTLQGAREVFAGDLEFHGGSVRATDDDE